MNITRKSIQILKTFIHYRSFVVGIIILIMFLALSIYAIIFYPYDHTVKIWNDIKTWEDYPKLAKPAWIKFFTRINELEGTIILDSRVHRFVKAKSSSGGWTYIILEKTFRYEYDVFPSQIVRWLYVNSSRPVYIKIEWIKPNGSVITVFEKVVERGEYYEDLSIESLDFVYTFCNYLKNRFGLEPNYILNGVIVLMSKEDESILDKDMVKLLKGVYKIVVRAETTDPNTDINIKLDIYGTLYGIVGTDENRRDLFIAIVWGAPIALSFGFVAAIVITFVQLFIAATSAWYGGVVDIVIQRVNEIFMIIPFLPIVIMISLFYNLSLWDLLVVVVALDIWGGRLKTLRAMFLQVKEMPYVEVAQAYGASGLRIVIRYMIPRVLPLIIPSIVLSIPDYVFLEAVLALMGIIDPRTISWGRVLEESFNAGALYKGYYHWILAPALMLVLVSIAFAFIGFTLDRVLNPKLKEM